MAHDSDGWIRHDGSARPVGPGTRVEVRFRDGREPGANIAALWDTEGDWWRWHGRATDNIVAYRLAPDPADFRDTRISELEAERDTLLAALRAWREARRGAMAETAANGASIRHAPAEDEALVAAEANLLALLDGREARDR